MSQPGSLRWFFIALVVVAIGGPFALFWAFPDQRELVVRLETNVAELSAAVEPLRSTLGLSAPPARAVPTAPAADPDVVERTGRQRASVPPAPAAEPGGEQAVTSGDDPSGHTTPAAPGAEAPATEDNAIASDDHVYSSVDADVVPPEPLQPLLRRDVGVGVRPESLGTVEYIVNEAGDVTIVRLVRQPESALDGMLLAAVKAWRFKPAMKDGRPVKYRQTILMID